MTTETSSTPAAPAPTEACAAEPIHLPGSIQPHGALLVVEPGSLALLQASANASALLGARLEPGADWPADVPAVTALRDALAAMRDADSAPRTRLIDAGGRRLSVTCHGGAQGTIVEVEPASHDETQTFEALFPSIRGFVDRIDAAGDIAALARLAAVEVRRLTGFDRVMVYRFDAEWNGSVIAEDGDAALPSYLGLRFPASDIPAQARRLYQRSRLRMIPDADYVPVPVRPAASPVDGRALDLSDATLRSVAPVHLEYMRNMGTAASMSMSILVDGRLWGLVSCHHARPRAIGPQLRSACDFVSQVLASQIGARERVADADARLALKDIESELLARISRASTIQGGLVENRDRWLGFVAAAGAAIVKDDTVLTAGRTPPTDEIAALAAWLHRQGAAPVFATDALARHYPPAGAFADCACGLLAVSVSALHPHFIMWFRPELVRTVSWGGEPEKAAAADGRLHPRRSFAQWIEEVRGRSAPWTRAECDAAESFRNALYAFVLKRAEERAELTEKLETSNRELEAFSYSISHDLRAPFRHVVGYAQLLREQLADSDDERSRHYVDSIIEAGVSAGQLVDDLLSFSQLGRAALDPSRVDMGKLVREVRRSLEIDLKDQPIEWVVGPLPPTFGDPSLLRQAVTNVMDNAVKYTRGRTPARIEIGGEERVHETVYTFRDNGVGFDMAYVGKLFGVFQRLHRAEEFEGTGIGLALVRRIVDLHGGWISAEGVLDAGAVFRIGLPRHPREAAR